MNASTETELKAIKIELKASNSKLDTISNLIGGSCYGEDGLIAKQKQDREEIRAIRDSVSALKRIRVEIALVSGFIGASLKTLIDWVVSENHHDQD